MKRLVGYLLGNPRHLPQHAQLRRYQILFTSFITFIFAGLCDLPGFPFGAQLRYVALLSGFVHFVVFFLLDFLRPRHFVLLNFFNLALLGFTIHYTGGIVSPFILILSAVLIASAACGIDHPATLPFAMGTYVVVVFIEYFDVAPVLPISAETIYASPWTTVMVVIGTLGIVTLSGHFYELILRQLRARVEAEQEQKQQVIRRMGTLETRAELGGMVAKIAHDIHGPLTAISGWVQMLRENPRLDAEAKEDCEVMLTETERIAKLVERMLQFGKPSKESMAPLSPAEVLGAVITVIQFHPQARFIHIEKAFSLSPLIRINGNKENLQQVFFNVLKNAMEALSGRKNEGVIRVSVGMNGKFCVVEIEDNGPGMPAETMEKIRSGSFTTKETGSGLGLVICREIIKDHGGTLELQAAPSGGLRVRTLLPLVTSSN